MTRRAIKDYSPFAFRSDFAAPAKNETSDRLSQRR